MLSRSPCGKNSSESSSSCPGGGQHRLPAHVELLAGGILILANRQDRPGALSSNATREALELDSVCSHHWRIQGCSTGTCCPASTGSWMTFPASSSWLTEPRQVPLPCSLLPYPPTQALNKHQPWWVGISQPNKHFLSPFMTYCCPLLLYDQPRSHGTRAATLAPDPASPPAGLGLGGGCLCCYQGWASPFARL